MQLNESQSPVTRLYVQYRLPLQRFLCAGFGFDESQSEELVQMVFTKFLRQSDRPLPEHIEAYLFKSAQNLAIDFKRQQARRGRYHEEGQSPDSYSQGEHQNPERIHSAKQGLGKISAVLAALPEGKRRVLEMSRLEGLSNVEIARREGVSETAIRKRLARILLDLRQALDFEEERLIP